MKLETVRRFQRWLGLLLPQFASLKDFPNLNKAERWILQLLFFLGILATLVWFNAQWPLPMIPDAGAGHWLRYYWLPGVFLLVCGVSWLTWTLNTLPGWVSRFAALNATWNEELTLLEEGGVPLSRWKLLLVLGQPQGGHEAFFAAASMPLLPPGPTDQASLSLRKWHQKAGKGSVADSLLLFWLKPEVEVDAFAHLCRRLRESRGELPPIHAVLAFADARAPVFWKEQLQAVRDLLQVQCPCWLLFDHAADATTLQRLASQDQDTRPLGCVVRVLPNAAESRASLTEPLDQFFFEVLPTRMLTAMDVPDPPHHGRFNCSLLDEGNADLFLLADAWRERWEKVGGQVVNALLLSQQTIMPEAAPHLIGVGLVSAAAPKFADAWMGVVRNHLDHVRWSGSALAADTRAQRLTMLGYLLLAIVTVGLAAATIWRFG